MNKGVLNRNVVNSLWRHRTIASSCNYLIAGIIRLFTGISMKKKTHARNYHAIQDRCSTKHRRSQGGLRGQCFPPKFLEHIIILCLERRFPEQNSVIRLKNQNFAAPQFLIWRRSCHKTWGLSSQYTCSTMYFISNQTVLIWKVVKGVFVFV